MIPLIHVAAPWVIPPSFAPDAVIFDGANDWLNRAALIGAADTNTFLASCWVFLNSTINSHMLFWNGTGAAWADRKCWISVNNDTANITVQLRTSGNTKVWNATTSTVISTGAWYHILCARSGTTGQIYINGADASPSNVTTSTTNADFTNNFTAIGATHDGALGMAECEMAENYVTNEYLDISQASNRDKFYNSVTDTPVDLGSDGSTPTGTAPLIYFKGNASVWNAGTNAGSGGNYTINGSVADSVNEPVDAS